MKKLIFNINNKHIVVYLVQLVLKEEKKIMKKN